MCSCLVCFFLFVVYCLYLISAILYNLDVLRCFENRLLYTRRIDMGTRLDSFRLKLTFPVNLLHGFHVKN